MCGLPVRRVLQAKRGGCQPQGPQGEKEWPEVRPTEQAHTSEWGR